MRIEGLSGSKTIICRYSPAHLGGAFLYPKKEIKMDTYSRGKKGKVTKLGKAKTKKGRKAIVLTPHNTPNKSEDFRPFLRKICQQGYTHVYLDIAYLVGLTKKYNKVVRNYELYEEKVKSMKSRTILRKKNGKDEDQSSNR